MITEAKNSRILITGGAGYIGSATVQAFLDEGLEVSVLDNLSTGQRAAVDSRAHFIEGDVRDTELLEKVFAEDAYSAVVHLAAFKSITEGEEKPELYLENNVDGTHHVLMAMASSKVPHIIFSSSAAAYGPNGDNPCDENTNLQPSNVYGRTKLLAEELINSYVASDAIQKGTVLRYFNVAGSGSEFREQEPTGLFSHIAYALKNKKPIRIYGDDYDTHDGTCIRDYVHVSDIAQAHVAAFRKGGGIFNIGSGSGYSVQTIVDAFRVATDRELLVEYAPRRVGDIPFSTANIQKAQKELGWEPRQPLKTIVASTLHMYDL